MRFHWLVCSGVLICSAALLGCSSDSDSKAASAVDAGAKTDTVYARLGGRAGIETVVTDFLGRVTADPKINGYFLNSSLGAEHLSTCLVDQIASATGGTEKYTCRSMKDAHAGLGISKADFDDLVTHLTDALGAAKVSEADVGTIVKVLGPMATDIVEDATNDQSIYQRIGRKPAIQTVITNFHARVTADARINAFFAKTAADRLATCLVRQVCGATGGPCKYGEEIPDAEPGVKSPCRDMKESHLGLQIAKADFDALAEDLVMELDAAGVTTADRDAIVGVLAPMCPDIVEKGTCQ